MCPLLHFQLKKQEEAGIAAASSMEEEENEEEEEVELAQEPASNHDSSEEDLLSDDDIDDDDDAHDAQQKSLVENLERALSQNPCNYQAHVEYITILRKCGLLEKLRSARETMSSLFPLSPGMWQEWAQDEARLVSSDEDAAAVENLYERGVQEYLSVQLWSDFFEFKRQYDPDVAQYTSAGIGKMQGLYERGLTAVSLHFAEGIKIWTAYRQFEVDVLNNMTDAAEEVKAKQVEIIRSLYRRQLSVPLSNSSRTLKDYGVWEIQEGNHIGDETDELAGMPSNVASAYRKALQMCTERERYEERVSKEKPKDAELLQNYLSYIATEEGTGDPARAQVLYERAITEFPLTHDLWLKYTDYLEKNLKVSAIIISVYARAVRNCPWVQALWSRYLLALERSNAAESDISKVFEQSLHSGFMFSTAEEYLEHYLTRADGIRRRSSLMTDGVDKQSNVATLREIFNQAVQFLSTYFPDYLDRSFRLQSYWAQLEAQLANDMMAARGVWESLIKSSGWMVEVWKGYIMMELTLGNLTEVRTIYKRGYSRRIEGNGTEVLCEAWLRFEREYGSLDDYDRALSKVLPRLAEVNLLQQQQDAKTRSTAAVKDAKRDKLIIEKSTTKREASASGTNKHQNAPQKKRSFEKVNANPDKNSRKKPKISAVQGSDDVRVEVTSDKGKELIAAAPMEGEQEGSENVQAEPEKQGSTKKTVYTDECTAFVSRLAPEVTEEDLRDFFAPCSVKDVRLMKDRITGISRGFAYIDFENEQGLAEALSKNRQKLKGEKIKVLRSDPALGHKKTAVAHGDGSYGNRHNEHKKHEEMAGGKNRADSNRGRGRGGKFNPSHALHRRGGHVQLSGRNTFALPRAIARPLGFSGREGKEVVQEEVPKSNKEFRDMLLNQ